MSEQPESTNQDKRPSLRDAARRGVEAKRQAQTPPAAAPAVQKPAPAAPTPQKVKPPVVGVEQVTVRCGHVVPFELFDIKKDKFRAGRRKKLTDRDCSDCRNKAQAIRQAAEMEAARKRRQERAKQAPPPGKQQDRLPHGSRFEVTYDAARNEWSGTLTIPGDTPGGEARVFTGSKSAVFRLLHALDEMYRATPPAAEAAPGDDRAATGAG